MLWLCLLVMVVSVATQNCRAWGDNVTRCTCHEGEPQSRSNYYLADERFWFNSDWDRPYAEILTRRWSDNEALQRNVTYAQMFDIALFPATCRPTKFPTTRVPTTPKPTTARPTTKPTTPKPTSRTPTTNKPTPTPSPFPTTAKPTTRQPTTSKPTPVPQFTLLKLQESVFRVFCAAAYRVRENETWCGHNPGVGGRPYDWTAARAMMTGLLDLYTTLGFDPLCAPQISKLRTTIVEQVARPSWEWWNGTWFNETVEALTCGFEEATERPPLLTEDLYDQYLARPLLQRVWRLTESFFASKYKLEEEWPSERDDFGTSIYVPFIENLVNTSYVRRNEMRIHYPYYAGRAAWFLFHTFAQKIADCGGQQSALISRFLQFFLGFASSGQACPGCREHFISHVSLNDRNVESPDRSEGVTYYPLEWLLLGPNLKSKLENITSGNGLVLFIWKLHNTVTASVERGCVCRLLEKDDFLPFDCSETRQPRQYRGWPFLTRFEFEAEPSAWRSNRVAMQDLLNSINSFDTPQLRKQLHTTLEPFSVNPSLLDKLSELDQRMLPLLAQQYSAPTTNCGTLLPAVSSLTVNDLQPLSKFSCPPHESSPSDACFIKPPVVQLKCDPMKPPAFTLCLTFVSQNITMNECDADLLDLGEFTTLSLTRAELNIPGFPDSGAFWFRVWDAFSKDPAPNTPPIFQRLSTQQNGIFSFSGSLVLETLEPSRGVLDNATSGRVRVIDLVWQAPCFNISRRMFFSQIPEYPEPSGMQAAVQAAKIVIIGGGFSGLTATKTLLPALRQSSDLVVLENAVLMGGYDDILVSRRIADITTQAVGSGYYWDLKQTILRELVVVQEDIQVRRLALARELEGLGVKTWQHVSRTSIDQVLANFTGVVVDARSGCVLMRYRKMVVRLLLLSPSEQPVLDMYGFSYAAHTLIPTAIYLGFQVKVTTRSSTISRDVYSSSLAYSVMEDVFRHWNSSGQVVQIENLRYDLSCNNLSLSRKITALPLVARSRDFGRFSLHLGPKNLTILPNVSTIFTADNSIIETMHSLTRHYQTGLLNPVLKQTPAQQVELLGVDDFAISFSTASEEGMVQFYGIPTLGWTLRGFDDPTDPGFKFLHKVVIDIRDFYPPAELDSLSQFLVGVPAEKYGKWEIHAFIRQIASTYTLAGMSGAFFSPLMIDFIAPYINKNLVDIKCEIMAHASNRGNWHGFVS